MTHLKLDMNSGSIQFDGRWRSSSRGMWAISLVCAVAGIAISMLVIPPYFPTNDDAIIQQVLAGTVSGSPTPYVSLINFCLAWPLSRLFVVAPGVPWWTFFHLAVIAVSFALWGGSATRAMLLRGYRPKVIQSVAVQLATFVGAGCVFVGRLQFTTTSSLALSSALFSSLVAGLPGVAKGLSASDARRAGLLASLLLFLLGFCIRRESGLLALAFWWVSSGVLLIWSLRQGKGTGGSLDSEEGPSGRRMGARVLKALKRTKAVWAPMALATIAAGALVAVNTVAYSAPEWQEYWRQSSTMALFTDYPRSSYEENEELYQSLGWSEDLYTLLRGWYQLDPRFDADTAQQALEAGDVGVEELLSHPKSVLKARLSKLAQPVPGAVMLALGLAVVVGLIKTKGWRRFAILLATVLAAGLMSYLLAKGRLLDRAMYAITLPALAVVSALILDSARPSDAPAEAVPFKPGLRAPRLGLALILVISIALGASAVRQYGRGSDTYGWFMWQDRNVEQFYEICEDNPDTLYVFAGLGELANMNPWRMEWPTNQTSWAAWYYRAPWFSETLKEAGFKGRPTVGDLLDENVRLVTDSYTNLDLYRRYLGDTLGDDVNLQAERTFGDDVTIWRVVRG